MNTTDSNNTHDLSSNHTSLRTVAHHETVGQDMGARGDDHHSFSINYPLENPPAKQCDNPPVGSTRHSNTGDRYHGIPLVVIRHPDGTTCPAQFLMSQDEVIAFFRLKESKTKFPSKTIQRYRNMGLKTVRIGRRVWFRLDDVLCFLDRQQTRLE